MQDPLPTPDEERPLERDPTLYLLAFAIGTMVGMGLANIWIPESRRSRLPRIVRRRYRRVRRAGSTALDELRDASREVSGEFRDELGATLDAAREELADMVRQQIEGLRGAFHKEQRGFRR